MLTAVISDLHLGARRKHDLLRRPEFRERLFAELSGVDRLVLLGDTLEFREAPLERVVAEARPFFEELGEVMAGRPLLLSAGNHDHELAAQALPAGEPLPLELIVPGPGGPAGELAALVAPAELSLAYPGVWLRDDVYATHGHYLDRHNTVPAFESVAASLAMRLRGREGRTPSDYEAALTPLYEGLHALAQRRGPAAPNSGASLAVWRAVNGGSPLGRVVSGLVLPAAVGALNVAGVGPFHTDLSGAELRRAGLRAMQQVVHDLGIEARYVIFGHTHRAGPLPGDEEWPARLVNSGSWVYEPAFLGRTAEESPHWPGTIVFVGDEGPPEVRRVLAELAHDDLSPA